MFYDAITDFIFAEDEPEKSDIIFLPGGDFSESALYAAELYREDYAPLILPSGKYSITKGSFTSPDGKDYDNECEYLCSVLKNAGVPDQAILKENEATFTWENAIFSRRKTDEAGLLIRRAIICCQAFHSRRCLMYYQQQYPDTEFFVCPVVTRGISRDTWFLCRDGIDTVLKEVERCGKQFHEIIADAAGGLDD